MAEINPIPPTKLVYAESSREGEFRCLLLLHPNQIICDDIETDDGTYICEYNNQGHSDTFYYLEKLEIQ